MNLVDDVNKLYISALKPTAKQGIVRVSGLAEFAGWKVRICFVINNNNKSRFVL
jgi:glycine/D-amino acid oxidase-like deaminating enzyme